MYSIKYTDGVVIHPSWYSVYKKKKILVIRENSIIIDFRFLSGWTFDVRYSCALIVGTDCKLKQLTTKTTEHKLTKGLHVFDDKELYKNVDKTWAILNSRHDVEFVREICKKILEGSLDV